jgi:NlpC/P60 family putative phage cell wall peptidase
MSETAENPVAGAIVAEAMEWVGTPYRHQGARKGVGCDCLGLVRGVWRAVYGENAEEPGPYGADWAEASKGDPLVEAARRHCVERDVSDYVAGDLLLFRLRPRLPARHCGIAVGSDRFVHAYQGHAVLVSPLTPHWRRRLCGVFSFPQR